MGFKEFLNENWQNEDDEYKKLKKSFISYCDKQDIFRTPSSFVDFLKNEKLLISKKYAREILGKDICGIKDKSVITEYMKKIEEYLK